MDSAFVTVPRRDSGPQDSHLVAPRFAGHDTVMECKNTQKLADGLISFECREFDRIVPGHEWKLMDSTIGIHNLPSGAAQISADLRKPLSTIKRLAVLAIWVPHACIQFV